MMEPKELIFKSLKYFKNAAVWKYHQHQNNTGLASKTLIYGFNGSGKTTLSRVFTSIEREKLEDKLPDGASFSLELSDGQTVTSSSISNPFGNKLLVFNQDFIERNFKWEISKAEGIAHISEENLTKKKDYEQALNNYEAAETTLSEANNAYQTADNAVKTFKYDISKRVRELALSKNYTQAFDARKVDPTYSEREFTDDDILSDEALLYRKSLLSQSEAQPPLQEFSGIDFDIKTWVSEALQLLGKTPGVVLLEELHTHSDMLNWVDEGLKYHEQHNLETCLFCGNPLTADRKQALAGNFDTAWNTFVSQVQETSSKCTQHIQGFRAMYQNFPKEVEFQPSERAAFGPLRAALLESVTNIGLFLNAVSELLQRKSKNPSGVVDLSETVEGFELDDWVENFSKHTQSLRDFISKHNTAHKEFAAQQDQAFQDIRNHVFASEREKHTEVKTALRDTNDALKQANNTFNAIKETRDRLHNELSNHGIGAEKLNELLAMYLGHRALQLNALDIGYKLIRSDGKPAEHLSEGEKTALAFCYFLTQLEAENRKVKELVVVIDDPVSSLDTSARTHAYSLLVRKTKKCAQTIILTHNLEFMNMVKREFQNLENRNENNHVASLLSLECICDPNNLNDRSTRLVEMPSLLRDYDTEYHYLFDMVYDANQNKTSQFHYLLPNATRKLLEIFTAFISPDKPHFTSALMSHHEKLKDKLDIKALERLIQIESHGTMTGMQHLPVLTVEEAIDAAEASMKFIHELAPAHFKAMTKIVSK